VKPSDSDFLGVAPPLPRLAGGGQCFRMFTHVSLSQTTRGVGADLIILDEAAHIAPELFYQTILPILQMKNTALIALSSPGDSDNYMSRLIEAKDGADAWFKVVQAVMVCSECRKLSREKQLMCQHVPHTAHWLSKRKFERLKLLYKDAPGTGLREYAGMVVSDHAPCFNPDHIAMFAEGQHVVTQSAPDFIYVAADPSGGGPSHCAIVSGFFNRDGKFVVSILYFSSPLLPLCGLCSASGAAPVRGRELPPPYIFPPLLRDKGPFCP
jgi:hypothetical protein